MNEPKQSDIVENFDEQSILAEASAQTGLSDFGDRWFMEPMRKLLASWRDEAGFSEDGIRFQRRRAVHALVNRLRFIDALKKNPEILEEDVSVAAVIVGLPRTGSTLLHRLLANAPGINAMQWWETQSYAPYPGEVRGQPTARRAYAAKVMEEFVDAGMMSIHPFAIDAPDEEIIILDQLFVGTGPEAVALIPGFAHWISSYDHKAAYEDLKTILKFFQWQDQSRAGKRWVLKSPGHLPTLRTLLDVFPEATVITTHRDPLQTVPSYCSMIATLQRMSVDGLDEVEVGRFTAGRLAYFLDQYIEARDLLEADQFIDVNYKDLLVSPVEQARSILGRLSVVMGEGVEKVLDDWLIGNARDKRASHDYSLDQFGLTQSQLECDFAEYRKRFIA